MQVDLFWAGGEPFLSKVHWGVMQHLPNVADKEYVKSVEIFYNANLTISSHPSVGKIPEFLKRFNAMVCASIDGTETIAEYTRNGTKWETLRENLFHFSDVLGERFIVSSVLTLPVILDMKNLAQLVCDLGLRNIEFHYYVTDENTDRNALMHPKFFAASFAPTCSGYDN